MAAMVSLQQMSDLVSSLMLPNIGTGLVSAFLQFPWQLVLYEPRVEPLIPARFGDFLEVRPGSRFDHKGSVGSRTGSENEILCKRVNNRPKMISKMIFWNFVAIFSHFLHFGANFFTIFFNFCTKNCAKSKVFEFQNSRKFIFAPI